jgi:siroheme synthase (precorrin-2 oxidase/ferrochelatase)
VISVGTGGASPVLASWLRDQIGELLGPEVAVLAELVAEARQTARSAAPDDPSPDWREALDSGMLDLIRRGRIPEAKERLSACRSSSSD